MDSILDTIKKMLGISEEDTSFDVDIIININSAIMILNQLGIGPEEGFSITDNESEWDDLLGDRVDLDAVKTYIYLKVKLTFDPPQTSFAIEAIERQLTQLEWRLNNQAEGGVEDG